MIAFHDNCYTSFCIMTEHDYSLLIYIYNGQYIYIIYNIYNIYIMDNIIIVFHENWLFFFWKLPPYVYIKGTVTWATHIYLVRIWLSMTIHCWYIYIYIYIYIKGQFHNSLSRELVVILLLEAASLCVY